MVDKHPTKWVAAQERQDHPRECAFTSANEDEVIQVSDSDDGTGVLLSEDITGHKRETEFSNLECSPLGGGGPNNSATGKRKGSWLPSVPLQCDPPTSSCFMRINIEDKGSVRLVGPKLGHAPPVPLFRYQYDRQSTWNSKSAVTKFCFVCALAKSGLCFHNPPCCQSICDKCTLELVRAGIDLHNSKPECAVRAPFIGGKQFYMYLRKVLGKASGSRGKAKRYKKHDWKKHHLQNAHLDSAQPHEIAPDGLPVWWSQELLLGMEDDSESQDDCHNERSKRQKTNSMEKDKAYHQKQANHDTNVPVNNSEPHHCVHKPSSLEGITPGSDISPSGEVRLYTTQTKVIGPSPDERILETTVNTDGASTCSTCDGVESGGTLNELVPMESPGRPEHSTKADIVDMAPQGQTSPEVPLEHGENDGAGSPSPGPPRTSEDPQIQKADQESQLLKERRQATPSQDPQSRWQGTCIGSSHTSSVLGKPCSESQATWCSSGFHPASSSRQGTPISIPVSLPRPGTMEVPQNVPGFVIDILNEQSGLRVQGRGMNPPRKKIISPVLPGPMVIDNGPGANDVLLEPSGSGNNRHNLVLHSRGLTNMAIEPPLPSLELKRIAKGRAVQSLGSSNRSRVPELQSLRTAILLMASIQPNLFHRVPVINSRQILQPGHSTGAWRQYRELTRGGQGFQCLICRQMVTPLSRYFPRSIASAAQVLCTDCCALPHCLSPELRAIYMANHRQMNGCSGPSGDDFTASVIDLVSDDDDADDAVSVQPCGNNEGGFRSPQATCQTQRPQLVHNTMLSTCEQGRLQPVLDAAETTVQGGSHGLNHDEMVSAELSRKRAVTKKKRSLRPQGMSGWIKNGNKLDKQGTKESIEKKGGSRRMPLDDCCDGVNTPLPKRRLELQEGNQDTSDGLQGIDMVKSTRRHKKRRLNSRGSISEGCRLQPPLTRSSKRDSALMTTPKQCNKRSPENRRPGHGNNQGHSVGLISPTSSCQHCSEHKSKLGSSQGQRTSSICDKSGMPSTGNDLSELGDRKESKLRGRHVGDCATGSTPSEGIDAVSSPAQCAGPTHGIATAALGIDFSVKTNSASMAYGHLPHEAKASETRALMQNCFSKKDKVPGGVARGGFVGHSDMKNPLGSRNGVMGQDCLQSSMGSYLFGKNCKKELEGNTDGEFLCPHKDSVAWKSAYDLVSGWSEKELEMKVSHLGLSELVGCLMSHAYIKMEDL